MGHNFSVSYSEDEKEVYEFMKGLSYEQKISVSQLMMKWGREKMLERLGNRYSPHSQEYKKEPAESDTQGWIKYLQESTDLGFIDMKAKEWSKRFAESELSMDKKRCLHYKTLRDFANGLWLEKYLVSMKASFRRPRPR